MSCIHQNGWIETPKHRSLPCNGQLLRYYRTQKGWSQETLADRAGYTCRLIRKAEAGRPVSADTIEVLAIALSCDLQTVTPEALISDPYHMASSFCEVLSREEGNAAKETNRWLAENLTMTVAGDREVFSFAGEYQGQCGYDQFCRCFFSQMFCPDKTFWKPRIMSHGNEAIAWGLQKMQIAGAPYDVTTILVFRFEFERGKIVRIEDEYDTEAGIAYFRKYAPHLLGRVQPDELDARM